MATKKEDARYTKSQILQANTLHYNVDLLQVLLKDDVLYSLDEVKSKVEAFNKREVKY